MTRAHDRQKTDARYPRAAARTRVRLGPHMSPAPRARSALPSICHHFAVAVAVAASRARPCSDVKGVSKRKTEAKSIDCFSPPPPDR